MGGVLFLGNYGSSLHLPPTPVLTRHSRMQAAGGAARARAGSAARGRSWLAPGLALLKAKAVNSALLKMSNKGEKKRKEKEKCVWGGHRVGVGEARAEGTGGDYLNRRPDSAVSFH